MRKTQEAFNWIVNILRENKILFQFTGGFAAKIYGSNRDLADFDIEISDKDIKKILPQINEFIVKGPTRYKDEQFDIFAVFVNYKGQEIDICGSNTQRLYNKNKCKWEKQNINLKNAIRKKAYGKMVPFIPLNDLIYYKKIIARKVDLQDIKNLGF